jgi:cytochrome c-type biogenesis protein CcmH/NrfG
MNVFISYRRDDSAAWAGRLCDCLNRLAGAERVFMDVEDIPPGDPFEQAIDGTIARCGAVLVVIGPRWAETLRERESAGQHDYVRREIEAALARRLRVVPVLVGGATMAQLTELRPPLSRLAEFQAVELRDSAFGDDCARLARSLGLPTARRRWIAAAALVVIAIAGLVLAFGPWREYRARRAGIERMLATARSQAGRSQFEAAFRTAQNVLKTEPNDAAGAELQLAAAMRWLQNFHVVADDAAQAAGIAGAQLAEIMPVLDAGLSRVGTVQESAAILAHIGWAHWLNQRIAHREFGQAAERHFRAALEKDPSNVFANAMLGNWLMQRGGPAQEALRHLRAAAASNRERPLVRNMQLGALVHARDPEARVELIRVANEMRRQGEPVDEVQRRRILALYSPTVNSAGELMEVLAAVAPGDAWATYVWLDGSRRDAGPEREFVRASLLEIERKRDEALAAFQDLRVRLKREGYDGRIAGHVDAAIHRLGFQK